MRKAMALILALSMVFALCGCGHQHTWVEATCTDPKTCSECGETEGEALGHKWKEATCTDPKTCSVCGETEGDPLGHDWAEATCTKPRTCKRCGMTDGKPNGHVEGAWKTVNEPTLSREGKQQKVCTVCGEVIDTRITTKNLEYSGGEYNFTIDEFIEYLIDNTNTSKFRITELSEDYKEYGHGYSFYNISEGKLYAIVSMETNRSGNVTDLYIWGEIEAIMVAVHVFQTVIGKDVDFETCVKSLDNSHSYTYGGFKLTYTAPEKDIYVFKIVKA